MNGNGQSRDELLRQADLVRARLLHTVDELERRRQEALDLRGQIQRHLRGMSAIGGVVVVGTAAVVSLLAHRSATAAARRRHARWALATSLWKHPERALTKPRRPFFVEVLRGLALSLVTTALGLPLRRALVELLQPDPKRRSSAEAFATQPRLLGPASSDGRGD